MRHKVLLDQLDDVYRIALVDTRGRCIEVVTTTSPAVAAAVAYGFVHLYAAEPARKATDLYATLIGSLRGDTHDDTR